MTLRHVNFRPRLQMRRIWRSRVLLTCVAFSITYLIGGYSSSHDLFPYSVIRAVKASFNTTSPNRFAFDNTGRLVSDENKTAVSCPSQSPRTAVLLIMGQSNAANHGGQRVRSEHGSKVANFFKGQCYSAESPLLGADGITGEYWTEVGNLLISSGSFDQVVLAPAAISGSAVSRWSPGGDLNPLMIDTTNELQHQGYRVTHVLWHQGEMDYVAGTTEKSYSDSFAALVGALRSQDVTANIYVSVASKCLGESNGGTHKHFADNPITRAQQALSHHQLGLRSGINTDTLLSDLDRHDDCHFAGSGQQKAAEAWANLLIKDLRPSLSAHSETGSASPR